MLGSVALLVAPFGRHLADGERRAGGDPRAIVAAVWDRRPLPAWCNQRAECQRARSRSCPATHAGAVAVVVVAPVAAVHAEPHRLTGLGVCVAVVAVVAVRGVAGRLLASLDAGVRVPERVVVSVLVIDGRLRA